MSGRKKSEVSSVLRGAEKTRSNIFTRYLNKIEKQNALFEKTRNQLQNKPLRPQFEKEVAKYYQHDLERIEKVFSQSSEKPESPNISALLKRTEQIKSEIATNDANVKELRDRILSSQSNDYFNQEYEESEKLLSNYDRFQNDLRELEGEWTQKARILIEQNNAWGAEIDKLNNACKEAERLNVQAKKREADEQNASLQIQDAKDRFYRINGVQADKYFPTEYTELVTKQRELERSGLDALTLAASHLNKLSDFALRLDEQITQFEIQQQEARSLLDELTKNLQENAYTHPLDPGAQLTLPQFAKEISGNCDQLNSVETKFQKIKHLIERESFQEAIQLANIASKEISSLSNTCDQQMVQINNQLETAQVLEDVLLEMGYKAHTSLKGNCLADGVVVRTTRPVSTVYLDLTNIVVHDSERGEQTKIEINFDVDDIDCQNKVSQLQQKLRQQGISMKMLNWGTASPSSVARGQEGENQQVRGK